MVQNESLSSHCIFPSWEPTYLHAYKVRYMVEQYMHTVRTKCIGLCALRSGGNLRGDFMAINVRRNAKASPQMREEDNLPRLHPTQIHTFGANGYTHVVLASSTQTRSGFAFIDVLRTKFPRESLGTLTFHGLRFGKIAASGSILTKIASQAIIRDDLAKLTSESNGTRALVEIRSRLIGTNASIDTRNRIAILRRGAWG